MSRYELRCRACSVPSPLLDAHVCAGCLGPLEVRYHDDGVGGRALRHEIEAGPPSIWRYWRLLPVERPVDRGQVGWTPLQRAERLGEALGLHDLWLKNDTVNPSFSFKDRVVAVAAQKAKEFGYTTIACASTGNLAGAVAAAAARLGLAAVVFVPASVEAAKLTAPIVYGARLVEVDGTYDEVNRLVAQIADERHWAFVNFTLRPYYVEGSKTLLFESVEQLGWRLPTAVVIPIASGALFVNTAKARRELVERGLVADTPVRFFGAQPTGCAPVAEAYEVGAERFTPVRTPKTIAHSLAIGSPADGDASLQLARDSSGAVLSATDEEIVEAIGLVARTEGLFVEPAAGTTLACLAHLARSGALERDARIVAYVTGNGFKTPEAVGDVRRNALRIPPRLEAFESALPTAREPLEVA